LKKIVCKELGGCDKKGMRLRNEAGAVALLPRSDDTDILKRPVLAPPSPQARAGRSLVEVAFHFPVMFC
jgi:hypothetical protein